MISRNGFEVKTGFIVVVLLPDRHRGSPRCIRHHHDSMCPGNWTAECCSRHYFCCTHLFLDSTRTNFWIVMPRAARRCCQWMAARRPFRSRAVRQCCQWMDASQRCRWTDAPRWFRWKALPRQNPSPEPPGCWPWLRFAASDFDPASIAVCRSLHGLYHSFGLPCARCCDPCSC